MADGLFYGQHELVEIPSSGPQAANDATAKAPLGCMLRYNGAVYRYVKFDNGGHNVAAVAYGVAYWKSLSPSAGTFTVTSDETDTIAGINGVAGILGCVVSDQYYTWVQVGGVATALTASGMAAGDKCIGYTTDLNFNRIQAGSNVTDQIFAIAISARNGTTGTSSVLLQNLIW